MGCLPLDSLPANGLGSCQVSKCLSARLFQPPLAKTATIAKPPHGNRRVPHGIRLFCLTLWDGDRVGRGEQIRRRQQKRGKRALIEYVSGRHLCPTLVSAPC